MTDQNLPDVEQPQPTEQLAGPPAALAAESAEAASVTEPAASTAQPRPAKRRFSFRLPRSRWIGLALFLLGATLQFLIVASDQRFTFSVLLGLFSCAVAALGALSFVGSLEPTESPAQTVVELSDLARPLGQIALSGAALLIALRSAVAGVIPHAILVCSVLMPALFVWLIVAIFRLGQKLGAFQQEDSSPRALYERHGFWLLALSTLLYLPMLGSYSLIDPWETHYGEVAREMLARDDWISLWWAQDGWFWSKPILNFWIQGLSFSLLGVRYAPDQMLAGTESGLWPQPEWAARFPVFLLTILGSYVLYKSTARFFGRRAAFLGGLVLITAPYWLLIARQTMTDMPYVATLTAALGLLLLGLLTGDEKLPSVEVRSARGRWRFSGMHLLLVVVIMSALPQIMYLGSRNLTLHYTRTDSEAEQAARPSISLVDLLRRRAFPRGFRAHTDEVVEGSGEGNCGLPGNTDCKQLAQLNNTRFQPALAALLYAVLLGAFVWANRKEQGKSRTYFLAAWYAVALAAMAKGAPGLVLPLFVFGSYVVLRNDLKQLLRADLAGMLMLLGFVCMPWFVQMYMRHGEPFVERLLWHDMYQRAFEHVHDTNEGDDVSFRYYIWQLGYGLFPWNGVCAAGLVWWFRRQRDEYDRIHESALLLFLWAIAAFGMFTITLTKFHHYILPMVPPIAALSGLLIDEAMGNDPTVGHSWRQKLGYYFGIALGISMATLGVAFCLPGSVLGTVVADAQPHPIIAAVLLIAGALLTVFSALRFGGRAPVVGAAGASPVAPIVGAIGLVAAAAALLAGRDMAIDKSGDLKGSIRLIHLFTYQYQRPWPESLDFRPALFAVTIVAAVLFLGWMVHGLRRHAVVAVGTLSLLFAAWMADVYLVKAAPHWGQRETIMAYYKARKSPDEWLVAYQMNWKGENFYTSNRVPAFVATGKKFKDWIKEQTDSGKKVMFFTSEQGRLTGLKRELGTPKQFKVITDKTLNNKFFLARVEFN
ncbi:MAG TPA: glycosyltransferase family 39 protein [Polyangiaceae bacterium]|nr:glycosyltransferase family 39 protein [Polyangiaceae bacterium]